MLLFSFLYAIPILAAMSLMSTELFFAQKLIWRDSPFDTSGRSEAPHGPGGPQKRPLPIGLLGGQPTGVKAASSFSHSASLPPPLPQLGGEVYPPLAAPKVTRGGGGLNTKALEMRLSCTIRTGNSRDRWRVRRLIERKGRKNNHIKFPESWRHLLLNSFLPS